MILFLLKALTFILGHLPLTLQYHMGRVAGFIAYQIDRSHRRIALKNLELAYGDELPGVERIRIVRELYRGLGLGLMEFFRIPWLKPGDFEGFVEVDGLEHMEKALAKGKGVIFSTAHFGNWELMAAYCAVMVHPIDIIARKMDIKPIEEFMLWLRSRSGNRMIPKKKSMRKLLRVIKDNGVLGILVDQNVTRSEAVFVNFFDTLASTNKGPALIAQRTGAVVIPAFIIREGKGRTHRIVIEKEVELASSGDKDADTLENTQRITASVERMIRRYPEQWFWVHRRWRTRPKP